MIKNKKTKKKKIKTEQLEGGIKLSFYHSTNVSIKKPMGIPY
jgi:hypothetical protein